MREIKQGISGKSKNNVKHIAEVAITVKDGLHSEKDWLDTAMTTIPCDANGSNVNPRRGPCTYIHSIKKPKDIAVYSNASVNAKGGLQGEKDWLEAALTTIHL
jgi:hypothetical protein